MVSSKQVMDTMCIIHGTASVNNEYPKAFAITHSNAADYSQFKAEMKLCNIHCIYKIR